MFLRRTRHNIRRIKKKNLFSLNGERTIYKRGVMYYSKRQFQRIATNNIPIDLLENVMLSL